MKKIILIVTITIISLSAFAQRSVLRKADKYYNTLAYSDAIPLYEYLLKQDSSRIQPMRRLAESYRLTSNTGKSEFWYSRLAINDVQPMSKFYYAEALLKNGKYEEARKWFTHPEVQVLNDPRVAEYLSSIQHLSELMHGDTANIKIWRLPFNSEESDYAPGIYGNDVVFASSRTYSSFVRRKHSWTDEKFVSLFKVSATDGYSNPEPFAPELKTKLNTGPFTFSADGKEIYYTANNPKAKSDKGYKNLKILSAKSENEKWKRTDKFSYNSKDYAHAHPALSPDGKILYFASNRPGGFGGMDLYMSKLMSDNTWGEPVNMGPLVNTKGDELFPFITTDYKLYFASNGHGGLGGLDIYSYDILAADKKAQNPGAPLNSSGDDFGLVFFPDSTKGFFSSDRGNNGINDDIYSVNLRPAKGLKIHVVDSLSGIAIAGSELKLFTPQFRDPILPLSGTGIFSVELEQNTIYTATATAQNYQMKNAALSNVDPKETFIIKLAKFNTCTLQGTITNKDNGEKIDSAWVTISNRLTGQALAKIITDSNGFYKYNAVVRGIVYDIKVNKDKFFAGEAQLDTRTVECGIAGKADIGFVKDIQMAPIIIGKAIKIDNIYFDLGKWNIRKDAALELDKIVSLMIENPDIIIELGSHTDSRGSDASNMTLSDKRAKSSAAYIVSKGIASDRIIGQGYGESMLVNECSNGVSCSEEMHQQNRRTEFKVTGFLK